MKQERGEREADQQYQRFLRCGQRDKKLQYAIEGYFEGQSAYRDYLKGHLRSAFDAAAAQGRMDWLESFYREGLLNEEEFQALLGRWEKPSRPGTWLRLLHLQRQLRSGGVERLLPPGKGPVSLGADLRNALWQVYDLFPFLDGAVAALKLVGRREDSSGRPWQILATDGRAIYYPDPASARPSPWIQREDGSARPLCRGLLHIILHCIFFHVWDTPLSDPAPFPWPAGWGEERLSDLACDIMVEFLIEQECWKRKDLRPFLGYLDQPGLWSGLYEAMKGRIWPALRIRQNLLGQLRTPAGERYLEGLENLVTFDSHKYWQKEKRGEISLLRSRWQSLALSYGLGDGDGSGFEGIGAFAGDKSQTLEGVEAGKADYRAFLHRFAIPREEMELDDAGFDYIYYTLGLERFGNMPLIEPLEYREGHKLEELVIAIDTSGSCSLPLVQRFLEESYAILEEKENFFKKMNVWILQCDCIVQDAVRIRNLRDWQEYLRNLKISGRAGTDFRPVFTYVKKLKEEGLLGDLKGLLYFTDGDGAYPRKSPGYEVAFVLPERKSALPPMPDWALRLFLSA